MTLLFQGGDGVRLGMWQDKALSGCGETKNKRDSGYLEARHDNGDSKVLSQGALRKACSTQEVGSLRSRGVTVLGIPVPQKAQAV